MEKLSCKSPQMCEKELWVYVLAYNLIRLLMAQAADTLFSPAGFERPLLEASRVRCRECRNQRIRIIIPGLSPDCRSSSTSALPSALKLPVSVVGPAEKLTVTVPSAATE